MLCSTFYFDTRTVVTWSLRKQGYMTSLVIALALYGYSQKQEETPRIDFRFDADDEACKYSPYSKYGVQNGKTQEDVSTRPRVLE